jgi:hypothetical protein
VLLDQEGVHSRVARMRALALCCCHVCWKEGLRGSRGSGNPDCCFPGQPGHEMSLGWCWYTQGRHANDASPMEAACRSSDETRACDLTSGFAILGEVGRATTQRAAVYMMYSKQHRNSSMPASTRHSSLSMVQVYNSTLQKAQSGMRWIPAC